MRDRGEKPDEMGSWHLTVGDPWAQKTQVFTSDALPFIPLGMN